MTTRGRGGVCIPNGLDLDRDAVLPHPKGAVVRRGNETAVVVYELERVDGVHVGSAISIGALTSTGFRPRLKQYNDGVLVPQHVRAALAAGYTITCPRRPLPGPRPNGQARARLLFLVLEGLLDSSRYHLKNSKPYVKKRERQPLEAKRVGNSSWHHKQTAEHSTRISACRPSVCKSPEPTILAGIRRNSGSAGKGGNRGQEHLLPSAAAATTWYRPSTRARPLGISGHFIAKLAMLTSTTSQLGSTLLERSA